MTLKMRVIAQDYEIPESAKSVVFYEQGQARVEEIATPMDIFDYSLPHRDGR